MLCTKCAAVCEYVVTHYGENHDERMTFSGPEDHATVCQEHHDSWASLQESAESGCFTCSGLVELNRTWIENPRIGYTMLDLRTLRTQGCFSKDFTNIAFELVKNAWNPEGLEDGGEWPLGLYCHPFQIKILPVCSSLNAVFAPGANPTPAHVYCVAIQQIQTWLNLYPLDDSASDSPPRMQLPTRLIDVGDATKGPIRLVTTVGLNPGVQYMALSHRWPNEPFLTCTKANIEDFSAPSGIDACCLTSTFQDMIRLAQDLGFRYVWIDSLCIVQDSLEDWVREPKTHEELL